MKIIALEEHFAMDGLKSMSGGGPAFAVVDKRLAAEWQRKCKDFAEWRIPDMDAAGIDAQVLSLTVPGIQAVKAPADAVEDAKLANDFLAKVISKHPTRFRGFAALPMQDDRFGSARR